MRGTIQLVSRVSASAGCGVDLREVVEGREKFVYKFRIYFQDSQFFNRSTLDRTYLFKPIVPAAGYIFLKIYFFYRFQ